MPNKMLTSSLLNIDPDKLFVEASISEAKEVQKKLQNEIDRKREELRTMVGERYRDLIEAADTISQMKTLSGEIIKDIDQMRLCTAELQKKQVSGFKLPDQSKDIHNNWQVVVAAHIKVLVDISEYIWEAVDESDFTQATSLFLMARVIKTSLEINPTFQTTKHFPVVSRQWSTIIHFKNTILKGAEDILRSQHNSLVSCSGLVSVALLLPLTSAQLLDHYLSLRSQALVTALSPTHNLDSDEIRHRLYLSYIILINSIIVAFHCFLEHVEAKEGLFWRELQRHVGLQAPPTLRYLDIGDTWTSHLPAAVAQFRPELESPLQRLSENKVLEAISSWVQCIRGHIRDQGGHLLQRLSSLRSLQGLRDPPLDISEEWPLITQRLQDISNVNLWNEMYRSLMTVRAKQLVSVHWEAAFKVLKQQIRSTFQAASTESKHPESDLLWYTWKECSSDLDNLNGSSTRRGLWLKSKGITPQVAGLCGVLEHKVSTLLADLVFLYPDQEVDPALLVLNQDLKVHQQTVCSKLINRLVEFVKELLAEANNEAGVMLLAKFLQSVSELCPSLNKCLPSVDNKVVWMLNVECLAAYEVWLALTSQELEKTIRHCLTFTSSHLQSLPQWEEIVIEEEGEGGEKLQSTLKVPCTSSLHLQAALHNLNTVIARVAVPKQICRKLIETVLKSMIDMYDSDLANARTQTQCIQMLLDIKYLSHLFDITSNKDLKSRFQDLISKLESKVDPFDLNIFTPYINDNFKKHLSQTQAMQGGGILLPGMGKMSASHNRDEPCTLALSKSPPSWFPLLHITTPRTTQAHVMPKGKKVSNSGVLANTPGTKQSSASSFFGSFFGD